MKKWIWEMITVNSIMPHKKANSLKSRNSDYLRCTYYGSTGRSDRSGKRRSAVELLEESKSHYVKSEKLLDSRQELKNADLYGGHNQCRVEVISTLPRVAHHRCHHAALPAYSVYPSYNHRERSMSSSKHDQFMTRKEYILQYPSSGISEVPSAQDTLKFYLSSQNSRPPSGQEKFRRSSVPSSSSTKASFPLQQCEIEGIGGFVHSTSSLFTAIGLQSGFNKKYSIDGGEVTSSAVVAPSSKHHHQSNSTNSPAVAKKEGNDDFMHPLPPLPPRNTRNSGKPTRPKDFPKRLRSRDDTSLEIIAPFQQFHPPPLKSLNTSDTKNTSEKLTESFKLPISLPSPILPPFPPTDVIMESPMSDSGPIISPPPAFSTPVTPLVDRQNSSASEKFSKVPSQHEIPTFFQMSEARSMISLTSNTNTSKSFRSVGGGGEMEITGNSMSSPDISLIKKSKIPSITTAESSSSAMSGSPNQYETTGSADDDSSGKSPPLPPPRSILSKKSPHIPKSITEHSLFHIDNLERSVKGSTCQTDGHHLQLHQRSTHQSTSSQTERTHLEKSGTRRPMLRSKSDLSHRYKKATSSHLLHGGRFALVQVDLGNEGRNHESVKESRRASRSSVELEKFFDMMGLESTDSSTAHPPSTHNPSSRNGCNRSNDSSPIFFSSVSSIDSVVQRGSGDSEDESHLLRETFIGGSRGCGGGGGYGYTSNNNGIPILTGISNAPSAGGATGSTATSSLLVQHGEPSIVERNARVIKWLYNCKKALENTRHHKHYLHYNIQTGIGR